MRATSGRGKIGKGRPKNDLGTVPIFAQRKWDCPLPKSGSYSSAARKASLRGPRAGFTLLEVILALAILCGAIAAVGELSRLGMRYAADARDMTQAQLLCESKLAEITAGLTPAEPEDGVPFETADDETESEWFYSVDVAPLDLDGLVQVRVTVAKDLPAEKRPVKVSLVRWIVDQGAELSE